MTDKDANASDNENKPRRKKASRPVATERPHDNVVQLMELFKLIKALPLKNLLLASTILGGLLVVGYFDYINYQPDLNPVHFAFLAAQAFVAGVLVATAFLMLFVSALMSSGSPAADISRKENNDPKGRVTAFFQVVLSHFPILFLGYAQTSSEAGERYSWWGGLFVWAIAFGLVSVFRYKTIRQARVQPALGDSVGTADHTIRKHDDKVNGAQGRAPNNHETDTAVGQLKEKASSAWATFAGELLANFGVMVFSAPALLLLLAIMEASPVSPNNEDTGLWMMWLMIAVTSGVCSIGKSIPVYGKMVLMAGAVFLILSYLQAFHLPVVAIARIAGFGQIADADLRLSDNRCMIVQQQLSAAGIPDRLICQGDKDGASDDAAAAADASPSSDIKTVGVLKKVLILSRAGSSYYIEISKGIKSAITNLDKPSAVPAAVSGSASVSAPDKPSGNANDVRLDKEDVVRFSVPKSEADDLVPLTRTLSTHKAEQYRKHLKVKH